MSRISEELVELKTDVRYIKEAIDKMSGIPDRVTVVEGKVSSNNLFQSLLTAVNGAIAVYLTFFMRRD